MLNWLLMVSTDNKPELTVSLADNIKAIFEEYGAELWLMFFFGLIAGILICNIYKAICNTIANKNTQKNEKATNNEKSDE